MLFEDNECYELKNCKVCGSGDCYDILDLGFHPVADTFLAKEQLSEPEVRYPLVVTACPVCGMVQTKYIVSAYVRYQKNDYCYQSSASQTAIKHFGELADRTLEILGSEDKGPVLDVGSNVGLLLQFFKDKGMDVIGIDPSPNICHKANSSGIETIEGFFDNESVLEAVKRKGKAYIVTATNVVNHANDLKTFMEAADLLLKDEGALVVEVPYLMTLIKNVEYDTIYHEHVSFFSIKPFKHLFQSFGYEIFHAEVVDYLGGTLRIFAGRIGKHKIDNTAAELEEQESAFKLHEKKTFREFAANVQKSRHELAGMLYDLKRQGKKIVGIGAPTKGNTLLNYCGLGNGVLEFLSDVIPEKHGRYTPGTHILIGTDEMACASNADYGLLLSWNLSDEIIRKLKENLGFRSSIIVPIPFPRII